MHWRIHPSYLNIAANTLLSLSMLFVIAAIFGWLSVRPEFLVQSVSATGEGGAPLQYVSETALVAAVQPAANGNWFRVSLSKIKSSVERIPWIRRAEVHRLWPNHISILVEEHHPFAFWGSEKLVNTYGEIFPPPREQLEPLRAFRTKSGQALPRFFGPENSASAVAKNYQAFKKKLTKLGLYPVEVLLSPRHAWTLRLNNGLSVLLGRGQELTLRKRLTQWVDLYPKVINSQKLLVDHVDLRYRNGFAIKPL